MKKVHKHRLALLLGILIALVFFYLGVNKWIESQESFVSTPPTIVRAKEPVQIKSQTQPVSADTSEAEEVEEEVGETTADIVSTEPAESPPVSTVAAGDNQTAPESSKEEPKPAETGKKDTELKKQDVVVEEEPKIIIRKAEKEFVIQIGAYKNPQNAQKAKTQASEKGFETFIVSEDGLYKVRVRVLAGSLKEALSTVRNQFANAFVVK